MGEPKRITRPYGIHSKLSYTITLISVVFLLYIGLTHINDPDQWSRDFSQLVLLEALFAMTGLLFTDMFYIKEFSIFPKKETQRPITIVTMVVVVIGLLTTQIIQVLSKVPYTISEAEIALGIVFSAPAEEAFFRAFFLTFMSFISESFDLKRYTLFKYKERKTGVEVVVGLNGFEFVAAFISAIMFALMHINYYGDNALMLSLFLMGLLFSFLFIFTKDITGLIIAHLLLNILVVSQWYLFVV